MADRDDGAPAEYWGDQRTWRDRMSDGQRSRDATSSDGARAYDWGGANWRERMLHQPPGPDAFTGVLWPMTGTSVVDNASASGNASSSSAPLPQAATAGGAQGAESPEQDVALDVGGDPTKLSSTACRRCRGQKLRCTKELEGCRRCQRQKVPCSYPPPPDRKLLNAIKRSESNVRKDQHAEIRNEAIAAAVNGDETASQAQQQQQQDHLSTRQAHPILPSPSDTRPAYSHATNTSRGSFSQDMDQDASSAALPPRTLGFSLLELYWTRFYKSALLFYKPQLFNDYMEGRLPDYLLRSLFAVASLLLVSPDEAPPNCNIDTSELLALAPFRSRGRAWFDSALKDAMVLAVMDPTLYVCQTLSSLMMFAFQTGEGHYADMILTLNYRCCTSLRYDRLDDFSLEAELSRRVLWETWSCYCVAGDPKYFVRNAWTEVANVPLPAMLLKSSSGGALQILPNETMDEDWHGHPCSLSVHPPQRGEGTPLYATYLKLIGIWSKVQLFAAEASSYTFAGRLDRIAQLSTLCDEVHQSDWSPRSFSSPDDAVDQSERLDVLIASEAMYRLCEMVIHSAIVPRFAGRSIPADAPAETVQAAAERVVVNATALAEMFERYHQQQVDLSITVGIAGYSAFIAGCALTIYSCTRPRDDASLPTIRTHVVAVLNLLNIMDRYWKVLVGPHKKLKEAAEYYGLVECATGSMPHVEDARFDRTPEDGAKLKVLAPGYVYTAAPGRSRKHFYDAAFLGKDSEPGSPSSPAQQHETPAQQSAPTPAAAVAQNVAASQGVMAPAFDPQLESFPMDWWNIPSPGQMGGNGMFNQLDSLGFVFDHSWI